MVHRFVPRCQFGCGCGWFGHGSVPCVGVVCWVVASGWRIHSVPAMGSAPGGAPLWSPRGLNLIQVCARWCPTLPHPGGCSTIGAVRLSFRVRDGAGRFPVAVTTETTTWAVRQCVLVILLSSCLATHTVCGWWCGLGVDRIVDASRLLWLLTPPTARGVWRVLGVLLFVLAY